MLMLPGICLGVKGFKRYNKLYLEGFASVDKVDFFALITPHALIALSRMTFSTATDTRPAAETCRRLPQVRA